MVLIILFISITFFSYELSKYIEEKSVLEKINKYISDKSDKYYDDYIKRNEKRQKINLKDKINLIYKMNLIIDKSGIQ